MSDIQHINVQAEFDRFFKAVIKQSRSNLTKGNHNTFKNLYKSLKYDFNESKNSISAFLEMEDYGEFLDKGVKGVKSGKSLAGYKYTTKKPPLRFIKTWLKKKDGRFRSRELTNRAFKVQNTIYQKGIKPTQFFSKPFEKEFNKLPDEIIEAYGLDLDDFLNFVFKE
ncbi:MAG: hypothetical protein HRT87_07515 [Legionellales bacterium]|nr:hypothetical protein [Legionellales bacterium]